MKKIILTALIAASLASTTAFASTIDLATSTTSSSMQITNPNSVRISANLGYGSTSGGISNFAEKKSAVVGGIAVAYDYALNEQVSVGAEVGFQYSNNFLSSDNAPVLIANKYIYYAKAQLDMISMPILATVHYKIPAVIGMDIFGKIGLSFNNIEEKIDLHKLPTSKTNKSNTVGFEAAIGASYKLPHGLNVFGQYTFNSIKFNDYDGGSSSGSMNTIAVGISYKLPIF